MVGGFFGILSHIGHVPPTGPRNTILPAFGRSRASFPAPAIRAGTFFLGAVSGRNFGRVAVRRAGHLVIGKPALSVQRGHAAHAGAGHRLTIDVVGQIARREDAGDRGAGAARFDLT